LQLKEGKINVRQAAAIIGIDPAFLAGRVSSAFRRKKASTAFLYCQCDQK
jgi:hypothetical protein